MSSLRPAFSILTTASLFSTDCAQQTAPRIAMATKNVPLRLMLTRYNSGGSLRKDSTANVESTPIAADSLSLEERTDRACRLSDALIVFHQREAHVTLAHRPEPRSEERRVGKECRSR